MHPDDLLEQLKANANARKQKNLDLIHAVCREQYERGSKDFSVATSLALPRNAAARLPSTIHNKTGDDFKGLISVGEPYRRRDPQGAQDDQQPRMGRARPDS
jgi:hypothetical protein